MTNFSNKKIFSIAKKLSPLFPDDLNPSQLFSAIRLKPNSGGMKEYFLALGPNNFLKIVIAIWGFKSGKSENDIINIYDKLFFTILLMKTDESYTPDCNECGGSGEIKCGDCSNGTKECPDCKGDGDDFCPDCQEGSIIVNCECCDGNGELEDGESCDCCGGEGTDSVECMTCDGRSRVDCETCDGNGEVSCNYCGSNGYEKCGNCAGDGFLTTDENYADIMLVCSWNKELYELCELREYSNEPILEYYNLLGMGNYIILNSYTDTHFEFIRSVEVDYIYCLTIFNDYPKLSLHDNLLFYNNLLYNPDVSHLTE